MPNTTVQTHQAIIIAKAAMNKLTALGASIIYLLYAAMPASAHVLVRDTIGKGGAIVHINPGDEPVADTPASIFFDLQGVPLATPRLSANGPDGNLILPTIQQGSSVSTTHTFHRGGVYRLTLEGWQSDTLAYRFVHDQRIEENSPAHVFIPPAWAQAGTILGGAGVAAIISIAATRRSAIAKYTKW